MTDKKPSKSTTDALEILDRLFYDGRPGRQKALEEARRESDVAGKVYAMRMDAGLTQKDVAQRVGTSPSVISRLEDADYGKHSLRMLYRVALALGRSVEVEFPEIARSQNSWYDRVPGTGVQGDQPSLWEEFATAFYGSSEKAGAESDDLPIAA